MVPLRRPTLYRLAHERAQSIARSYLIPKRRPSHPIARILYSVIEPIDFSGKEDEFLSSDLKQQVLAFSILWAVVGFILSAWIFLGKKVGPASLILDRRQAEGRVVDSSSHRGSTGDSGEGFSSSAPRVNPYVVPEQKPQDEWKNLARLVPAAQRPKTEPQADEKPVERKVVNVAATVDSEVNLPLQCVAPTLPSKRPEQVANENPDRLLYPVTSSRPEPGNLAAVGRQVERSMIRMTDVNGLYHVGLILDSSGKALISDSFINDGSIERVSYNGESIRGSLIARDAEYGIALIQLPAGSYATIPLAPDPPARGEELLAFGPSASRCLPTTVRTGASFGQAGFLVEGFLGSATWGSPLLNARGELVGCNFSSLPDFPGSGVHLAADSAAIYRLLRGYQNGSPSAYDNTLREALGRLTSLASESKDEDGTKRGRVLAKVGVSQFYIGMSREEANQWVSSPQRSSGRAGMENWRSPAPPLELVFVNDTLVAVSTDYTGFSTETGLSVGAPIDASLLRRSFERFLLVDGQAMIPGLDIMLDREGKARQFVVRPEL